MTTPTWTYTPQTPFGCNAAVLDETGEAIMAIARKPDASEANQIAALTAASPRLLAACRLALEALHADDWAIEPDDIELAAGKALSEAIEAATECEVSE